MLARLFARHRFALSLTLLSALQIAVAGALLLIFTRVPDSGQRNALLAALAFFLLLALGLGLRFVFRAYIFPLARLGEEIVLLKNNPAHRVMPQGGAAVRTLGATLNDLGATCQALQEDSEARIALAGRELAQERTRLAALMAELSVGVLVCNIEGRILLYNRHARQLLMRGKGAGEAPDSAPLGLGRSLFGLVERGLVVHALEQIQHRLHQQHDTEEPDAHNAAKAEVSSRFIAPLASGFLVRARMAPVLDESGKLGGFVLVLEDITREVEADSRRDALLQAFNRDARSALANLRAAVETVQAFPEMDGARRERFISVIEEESQRLARGVERALNEYGSEFEGRREFEEMRAEDLLGLLVRRLDSPALRVQPATAASGNGGNPAADADAGLWLAVDSYALSQALAHWCRQMADATQVREIFLGVRRDGGLARFEFGWMGAEPGAALLQSWEQASPAGDAGGEAMSIGAVLARHAGESVYRYDAGSASSRYCLLLPASAAPAPLAIAFRGEGRPVFYDFDLFQQAGQDAALDSLPLAQISYTVFDTETTGLYPAAGDEIISIGAVRIVNGRLLQQENFDRMIRPRCPVSAESVAIHGITEDMLAGHPRVEQVLPQFQRFVEDTVLVAHNAAFDLRFLQMQEAQTGVRFGQQVLDTLLLSQVIHPHQLEHTLEAIAARLGVTVVGRHTALGDAIVTAEVFLRMLPLLADKGIRTFGEARDAERQTRYARLRY
ncbi:exonuclease domain-containing protein [Janthinobacterium sp. 17J80-10]|uniref:exonuclease domain-containing protein n=1 Tax=Janthinobacterium sp. 17J80-10 TaxID=2497863 RepID=UPI00100532FB|nr:exonuclease domain-containing protein [Janthinobacterium sp. 17J80-10]QAU34757.1 DNA polymerase III subunit epsilon [Janthinobacterium sp. 17J80-10]